MSRRTAVTADVRRRNASLVFAELMAQGTCSRKDLREATGLVSGTVTAIVAELVERGLAQETGERVSTGGRPQRLLEAVSGRVLAALVVIDPEMIEVRAVDAGGRVLWHDALPHDGRRGDADSLVRAVATAVERARREILKCAGAWYLGAAIGVPGLVVNGEDLLITLEMPIRDLPLLARVRDSLPEPQQLMLLNTGRTAALAEWASIPVDQRPHLMAYVGIMEHGVSGGLVLDGDLVGGEHGLAGEAGHIVVESDGILCDCGARGCLSTVLSLTNLCRAAGVAAPAGPESCTGLLTGLLKDGDPAALAALERGARGLAAAVGTLSNLTDVGTVVVGGQMGGLWTWLEPAVTELIDSRHRVNPVFNPVVRLSGLGADGVATGLAHALRQKLVTDPLRVPALNP